MVTEERLRGLFLIILTQAMKPGKKGEDLRGDLESALIGMIENLRLREEFVGMLEEQKRQKLEMERQREGWL